MAPLTHSPGLPPLPLNRLLNTNVCYRSWQMKNDLRFTYRFAPDVMPGENPQSLATIDPLNPHRMEVPFEGSRTPATQFSIASMLGAPEEPNILVQAASIPPLPSTSSYASLASCAYPELLSSRQAPLLRCAPAAGPLCLYRADFSSFASRSFPHRLCILQQ